jgi:hypothetical protein
MQTGINVSLAYCCYHNAMPEICKNLDKYAHNNYLSISGAPYPAVFELPLLTSDETYDLSWHVNCSTPIIAYQLEFRDEDAINQIKAQILKIHWGLRRAE